MLTSIATAVPPRPVPDRGIFAAGTGGAQFFKLMPNVLIADADADRRDLYRTALEMAGFSVWEASSVADALPLAREHHPALVVASWDLADGDGARLCRELHGVAGQDDVPVVVIAEQPRAELRNPAASAGCEAVLSTPVLPDHLVEVACHLTGHDRRQPSVDPAESRPQRRWSSIRWQPRRRLRDQHI